MNIVKNLNKELFRLFPNSNDINSWYDSICKTWRILVKNIDKYLDKKQAIKLTELLKQEKKISVKKLNFLLDKALISR